jgi:Zn-dependent peptidase ImmA (M78 family)/DNA-binding XRE family transcriptional regulator
MDTPIFSQRLKNARIMQRLTLDQLCKRMGGIVTKAAVSKYESGKMLPSDDVKRALAKALEVDVSYLERPFDEGVEQCEIDFRKKSSMPMSEVKALLVMARNKAERYIEIRKILNESGVIEQYEPLGKKPVQTREDARVRALEMRSKLNLGYSPITDVQSVLENHGIMVIPVKASEDFDGLGATVSNSGEMFIVINQAKDHVERRRLTTLHELGHQVMDMTGVEPKEQEKLCHEFASEMLLPEKIIRNYYINDLMLLRKSFSLLRLRPIQLKYGISIDAIVKKANTLGIISPSRYSSYNIFKNNSPSYKTAVESSMFLETAETYDKYSMYVLIALSRNLISREKAAEMLYDADENVKADLNALIH